MDTDQKAKALVRRFEYESQALHRIQREWLEREIAALLRASALKSNLKPLNSSSEHFDPDDPIDGPVDLAHQQPIKPPA